MQRGAGICLTKSDPEREEAAAKFVKWLTEPEKNVQFVTSVGYMPVTEKAFRKAQRTDNVGVFLTLFKLILTYNADICHAACHTLWDIIIPEEKNLQGEVGALDEKCPFAFADFDVGFFQQIHSVLIEATF